MPALSLNEFLNPSAQVGVGGNFFLAFTHCSFTKGWILDSIVTWLSYICLRGVHVVPAMFLISLSTFLFLTSDISGLYSHLAIDGILVLFSGNRRCFLYKWSLHRQKWLNLHVCPLFFRNLALPPGKLTKNSHKLQFFKDKLDVIPL